MDLKEYKSKKIRKQILPSGLEIKTKGLSPYIIYKIRSENKIKDQTLDDLLDADTIKKLFIEFIIDPKIPDEIELEDFSADDFNAIYTAVINQIIVRPKKLEEVINVDRDFHS